MPGLTRVKAAQPEMRDAKLARYVEEYGLTEHDAAILDGESRKIADIFEAAAAICKKPKEVSNWLDCGYHASCLKYMKWMPEQI